MSSHFANNGDFIITVASSAGFCPGVRRAIDMANDFMKKANGRPVVMLGAIVHNEHVIAEFKRKGVTIVDRVEEIPPNALVIICLLYTSVRHCWGREGSYS